MAIAPDNVSVANKVSQNAVKQASLKFAIMHCSKSEMQHNLLEGSKRGKQLQQAKNIWRQSSRDHLKLYFSCYSQSKLILLLHANKLKIEDIYVVKGT